jgi:hypothetical protein
MKHEKLGEDDSVNWMLAPGKLAHPWRGPPFKGFNKIFHQVRHPLNNIGSIQKISKDAIYYIAEYLPESTNSVIDVCMNVYYHWNKLAEEISSWRYQIEEFPDIFEEFCEKIGNPDLRYKRDTLKLVSTNLNSAKPYTSMTWEALEQANTELCEQIKTLASRYGYEV